MPFRDVGDVDWLGEGHIERIDSQAGSVRGDWEHGKAQKKDKFETATLAACPALRFNFPETERFQAGCPIHKNYSQSDDERTMRINPDQEKWRKKPQCPRLVLAELLKHDERQDNKQIS